MRTAPSKTAGVTVASVAIAAVTCALLGVPGCGPVALQQQAGFGRTEVRPIPGKIGDVVAFDLRPPVGAGTEWDLETYGRVRFAGEPPTVSKAWVAEHDPIHLETVVAPWKPVTNQEKGESKSWLSFTLRQGGESQNIDRPLPLAIEPYKELAVVTVATAYQVEEKADRVWFTRTAERNAVTFKTTIDRGVPQLPKVRGILVETGGRQVLYAEVHTNFGEVEKDTVGYETTLSYPLSVTGPVDVVVVEWVGHGAYSGPFAVYKLTTAG